MARPSSNGLVQAMQSLRLSSQFPQRSLIPSSRHLARAYATEAETETNTAIQPESIPDLPVQAAPEIDFSTSFLRNPARIVPASPSYFSGSPRFVDHVLNLESLQARYAALPQLPAGEAPPNGLRLNRIQPEMVPGEVRTVLDSFLRPGNPYAVVRETPELDENGKARAKGKRKESKAVVHLVEGEGEVLVNGKSIVEAFPRVHDRESALWALRTTERMDKYNAWVTVRGGGVTGQTEAVTLAIARALMVHEPGLKPLLRRAGVITVDARRVERKKPGHVKARKMPAWVKR
ncbi:37S ribosomal protein S9 [Penicillium cosmopolitanum]|uniref:Small ribosomal subunit protein uS9m n=1 Tax=Penicillium cosmopolitanum TaxID=1131564 RepID=A0A9W9SEZ3_9EURO|nr:37S ribosomal protein S9 [Penicillium cosmopolitanum]KAJ5376379.1 37S ribosomal protein S9 [Penicillium cosmopolitanum]